MITVGTTVVTRFSGRPTQHEVAEVRAARNCQSGCLLRVTPEVPGSRDRDNPWDDGWIDSDWFKPVMAQLSLL